MKAIIKEILSVIFTSLFAIALIVHDDYKGVFSWWLCIIGLFPIYFSVNRFLNRIFNEDND